MVSNNEVVGASSSGVYVGFSVAESSTVTGNLSVVNNSFVDVGYAVYYTAEAYSDRALSIGRGQTTSQPYIAAFTSSGVGAVSRLL
jgi:hypothetical protein